MNYDGELKIDMNPVSWTKEKRGFYMAKLSYEDKKTRNILQIYKKYNIKDNYIKYIIRLINVHIFFLHNQIK